MKTPDHLKPVVAILAAELKRQQEQSGPYGALHYLSVNDEDEAHLEGSVDLGAVAEALWPKPTHQHKKGGLYTKMMDATHSETEEAMTVYMGADGRIWVRPKAMFDEADRFAPLEKSDAQ